MFICEIWLFDWYFPQFCKSDMSKYGYLEVFPFDFEMTRVDCIYRNQLSIGLIQKDWCHYIKAKPLRNNQFL